MNHPNGRGVPLLLHAAVGVALLLVFVGVSVIGTPPHREAVFASDRVYADLAIARHLLDYGFLGAGEERLPAQADSLWQMVLAVLMRAGAPPLATPIIAALLLSLGGLAATLSLVRTLHDRAAWSLWAAIAWVLILPAALDASAGVSASAAAAFALLGLSAYARGVDGEAPPLPLSAAFWIALAALFRVELLAVWFALALHAIVLSITKRIEASIPTIIVRFINGGLMAAIALAPVVWWNVKTLSVPWPPAPEAAMTINVAAGSAFGRAMAEGLIRGMAELWSGPLWSSPLMALFLLGGFGWLIADLARQQVDWAATVLFAGLLIPPAFAPLYPFFGAEALPYLQRVVQPLWMLLAGYAVVRTSDAVSLLVQRKTPQLNSSTAFVSAAILLGAMPLLVGMREQALAIRNQRAAKMQVQQTRAAIAEQLGAPEQVRGGVASDEPGWLLFQGYHRITDLTGRYHPIVLNWMRGGRVADEVELRAYLASRQTEVAVLWGGGEDRYGSLFACPSAAQAPYVCRFNPIAGP